MFKYFNSQFYGKHHRKNKYISLGGIEQPSVDVTDDCLHNHPENIADHVETHDKGHARRNYKNCCKVMLLFFIFSILPSVDASENEIKRRYGSYNHYCSEQGKKIKIGYNEQSWGHLVTPGFPTSIRPMNCSWLLDYSNFSNDQQKHLIIYATQVYVQMEYLTISSCENKDFTNCSRKKSINDWNISDGPYVRVTLTLPDSPYAHLRVIEVHDVYGVNMTYEVANIQNRINWFNCSAKRCNYNGRCIVKAKEDYSELESMKCVCNQPLVYSTFNYYFGAFYGDSCQYNSKLGYCSGPIDGHFDSLERCNGHPCYYYTSRMIKCNCSEGYQGDRCQYKEDKISASFLKLNFTLKALFSRWISDSEKTNLKYEIESELNRTVCLPGFCTIKSFLWKKSFSAQELLISFQTADATINQKLAEKESIRLENGLIIQLKAGVKVIKMNANKSNPVARGEALVMTCQYSGGPNLSTSWYKDKLQIETSNPEKLKADERYINENPVSNDGKVLHIENANQYDSGRFRCEVTDMGETVAKDLDEPVLVSRPPDLAILPAAIVLPQVGNRIDANIQESTIFCYVKGSLQDKNLYTFQWFKRGIHQRPSKNIEIRFGQGPEEIEMLELPVGSLLRLTGISRSARYTCRANMNNTSSQLEIPVDVIASSQINHKTCPHADHEKGYWPMAGLGTRVSIECPDGYVGRMDRRCGKNGKAPLGSSGKWEPVNKDNCVRTKLMEAKELLETFKSGYVDPMNKDGLWHIITFTLYNESEMAVQPNLKEWNLFLQILHQTLSYLKYLDKLNRTQSGTKWTRQVYNNYLDIISFFKIIKHLLRHISSFSENQYGNYRYSRIDRTSYRDMLETIRWHSLLIGRNFSSENKTKTFSIPHCDVSVKQVNLAKRQNWTELTMLESEKNESINEFFHGTHVLLQWPQEQTLSGNNNIFIISVIIIDQLKDIIETPNHHLHQYALRSHLVTIAIETKVSNKLNESEPAYEPRDQLALERDYMFVIRFDAYAKNNSANQSSYTNQSQLQCGSVNLHTLEMRNATTCSLQFLQAEEVENLKIPACVCPSSGTYGLMELLPSVPHSPVPEALPSLPVIYGCLTSMILSLLSWVVLVKSCKRSPKKFYTFCKISTSFAVFLSSLIFILEVNEVLPIDWAHFVSCLLQVTMLTGLSCQLGMAILLLSEYRAVLSSRLSHVLLCILSCLGPTLVVSILSAGCTNSYQYHRDWWVAIGGYHFSSYISVLVILLMFLAAVLAFLWYILFYLEVDFDGRNSCLGGGTAGQGRDSMLAQHRAVLKRIILVSGILVLYNVSSVLFVNWRDYHFSDYLFAIVTVALGFTIILCYILTSETYILVSCGEKSQDDWKDFKSNDVQMRGSRSDSGSSRLTTSSSLFTKYPKVNKKEPLQRVSDIQEVYEVQYEDPDSHFNSRMYHVSSIIHKANHQISAFGPVSSSPSRNPPPLPKRAKCFLLDNSLPLPPPPPNHPPPSFSPPRMSSAATSPNQPPSLPFPVPSFMPTTLVSKEPEPLDIVIGRASKEQSGIGKMPLPSQIGGSGSMSTDLTTSSRRTTLSIATSLESEYVPPHGHNSPSPVIGRFARAYGLTSSCDDDTDYGQEDEVEHNFPTMVLARSRSGDNYTEMTSPLSPMSQTDSIADMMARESSGLSGGSTTVTAPSESNSVPQFQLSLPDKQLQDDADILTKETNIGSSSSYSGGGMIHNRYSFDTLHNMKTRDWYEGEPSTQTQRNRTCTPNEMCSTKPLAPDQEEMYPDKSDSLDHYLTSDLLSSHQLPDYLNADRGAMLSALFASMKMKGKASSCCHRLDSSTPSLSAIHLQEGSSEVGKQGNDNLSPAASLRTTRALSTPSCTVAQSYLASRQNRMNQITCSPLSTSSSSNCSPCNAAVSSAMSTRIFENMLNDTSSSYSSSAQNLSSGGGCGEIGTPLRFRIRHSQQAADKKGILKKIQSASEMSSSGGLSDDSGHQHLGRTRIRMFPSEI